MDQVLEYQLDMDAHSKWEIISTGSAAKQHLMYIQEGGIFYSGAGYYTTRSGLDSYLIKITLSGQGALDYDGQVYTLNPGDFFWIDCRKPQDYRTHPSSDHWHIIWVHFWGGNAHDYYTLFRQLNQDRPVGHLAENTALLHIPEKIMQMYQTHADEITTDIRSATLLTQLLAGLLESVFKTPVSSVPPPAILAVRSYLQENYRQQITLDCLSKRFNISKFYLQRVFSHCTGLSPFAYQQKIRLTKSKELLRTTNQPISLIAFCVGFESTSAYIAAFKKQEGTTPLKYRTEWSNGNSM